MHRSYRFGPVPLFLLACCLLFAGGLASAKPLVLAQISDRPKKDFHQLRPMAEHVVQALAPFGFEYPDSTPGRLPAELLQKMRIIHRSATCPQAFELTTANLDPEALQRTLLALDPKQDRDLLQDYKQSTRLTPVKTEDLYLLQSLEVDILP